MGPDVYDEYFNSKFLHKTGISIYIFIKKCANIFASLGTIYHHNSKVGCI